MEDDEFNEEARHRRLVERRMKSNLTGLVVVDAEADGLAAPAARAASPPYGRPHSPLEVHLVELVENLTQVISPTPRREDFVPSIPVLPDARLLSTDEVVQEAAGAPLAAAGVVGNRPQHRGRGVEKHVVQAQTEGSRSPPEADHRAPVVGHRQPDGQAELPGEQLRQRGRLFHEHLACRQTVRGSRFELEEQKLAG